MCVRHEKVLRSVQVLHCAGQPAEVAGKEVLGRRAERGAVEDKILGILSSIAGPLGRKNS